MAKSSSKKRKVVVEAFGEAHINASFNNNQAGEGLTLIPST